MLALIVGTGLAVAGLFYVLTPLLRGEDDSRTRRPYAPELMAPEASALEAMREIEFDQATGKLSPEDYATLKATYAPRALAELEARESLGGRSAATSHLAGTDEAPSIAEAGAMTAGADAAERLIARMRTRATSCPTHGPRPESDAIYCSDCGQYLASSCLRCGAAIDDPQSRFCGECGAALAA